jgi:hypothetical protein
MLSSGLLISGAGPSIPCAPLIAQAVRAICFCLGEYSVMPHYIDKASLHAAVRCDPRTIQVLGYAIPKVASFGPREQFLLLIATPETVGPARSLTQTGNLRGIALLPRRLELASDFATQLFGTRVAVAWGSEASPSRLT